MSGSVTGRAEDRLLVSWAMRHCSYDSCSFDGSVSQDTVSALTSHRWVGGCHNRSSVLLDSREWRTRKPVRNSDIRGERSRELNSLCFWFYEEGAVEL